MAGGEPPVAVVLVIRSAPLAVIHRRQAPGSVVRVLPAQWLVGGSAPDRRDPLDQAVAGVPRRENRGPLLGPPLDLSPERIVTVGQARPADDTRGGAAFTIVAGRRVESEARVPADNASERIELALDGEAARGLTGGPAQHVAFELHRARGILGLDNPAERVRCELDLLIVGVGDLDDVASNIVFVARRLAGHGARDHAVGRVV